MKETISVHDLADQISTESGPRVIDIRDGDAYAAGHIPGAQHIPADRLVLVPGEVDDGRPVVIYTDEAGGENLSEQDTARRLRERGMQVVTLEGGFPAWVEAGQQVEFYEKNFPDE